MEKVSLHESVNILHEKVKKDGITSVFERFEAQEKTRCSYCKQGISCQLCSQGPCRITKHADRGVCGIDANGMVMRKMVHLNIFGAAAYSYHAKEAIKTLKATAEGKTPFKIKNVDDLNSTAKACGIATNGNVADTAIKLADFFWSEFHRDSDEESKVVEIFAPESRKKLWRQLGIFPGGPLHETIDTESRCMTNIDSDYVSLAKMAMRMSISMAYCSQVVLEIIHDILFGMPEPHETMMDLGILDKDYVNIVPNGHEPFVGVAMLELAKRPEVQQMAKDAGAKGIRIAGSIETGQEMIQRFPTDDVFVGMTGNWLNQEYVMATGAVDLFACDMNCSVPTLSLYEQKYNSTVANVSKLVRLPGINRNYEYIPEKVESLAMELIKLAIENFKKRKGKDTLIPNKTQKAIVGFSIGSVLKALGGTLNPLLDVIKNGSIKGVTALVSCTTLTNGPQDAVTVAVAKELIKRDILVLSAGCGNGALQVAGLQTTEAASMAGAGLKAVCNALGIPPVLSFGTCTDTGRLANLVTAVANALGVDTKDLPVAVTAPEYMEQKATIDAIFAVAFGLYTHVSPVPAVTGAPDVVKLLTEDVENITGGKVAVGDDPVQIADGIEQHIMKKRKALGI
ncbi:MAG: anaerobic carbon-monoxide dehydrogenase catalytic subunit [Candidatus Magnetoovum sp. WYHC-5]|nr:anaerobic carbon-monoxide dehydrogenase catalytic subunit [Candidatus Magnetoovum sp. WYHC-5]